MVKKISRVDHSNNYFAMQKKARNREQEYLRAVIDKINKLESSKTDFDNYLLPVFSKIKNDFYRPLSKLFRLLTR